MEYGSVSGVCCVSLKIYIQIPNAHVKCQTHIDMHL